MAIAEMQHLADRYEARFGGLDEILAPQIMTLPAFLALLESTLATGQPLTRAAIEAQLGAVDWGEDCLLDEPGMGS